MLSLILPASRRFDTNLSLLDKVSDILVVLYSFNGAKISLKVSLFEATSFKILGDIYRVDPASFEVPVLLVTD